MLSAMAAADLHYKFTQDDIICVVWSSWSRLDMISKIATHEDDVRPHWCQFGNVHSATQDSEELQYYAENLWSLENDIVKNITAIHTANRAFNIDFQATLPVNEITHIHTEDKLLDAFSNVKFCDVVYQLPNTRYENVKKISEAWNVLRRLDGHPSPGIALDFVNDHVLPALAHKNVPPMSSNQKKFWNEEDHNFITSFMVKLKNEQSTKKINDIKLKWQAHWTYQTAQFREELYTDQNSWLWDPWDDQLSDLLKLFGNKD